MNAPPEPRFARIASMIGDPTRARMLAGLLDGGMLTAGEIAHAAHVAPQTASAHLAKLLETGLIAVRTQGRHRYFKLADGDVAHALEALAVLGERDNGLAAVRSSWTRDAMQPLRHARSCYGHLAGRLGVRLHDALIERAIVTLDGDRHVLDDAGRRRLQQLEFDASGVGVARRGVAYPCIDWSERRDHFAGPLAVALLDHFVARRWLSRSPGSRVLTVGPLVHPAFDRLLDGMPARD